MRCQVPALMSNSSRWAPYSSAPLAPLNSTCRTPRSAVWGALDPVSNVRKSKPALTTRSLAVIAKAGGVSTTIGPDTFDGDHWMAPVAPRPMPDCTITCALGGSTVQSRCPLSGPITYAVGSAGFGSNPALASNPASSSLNWV